MKKEGDGGGSERGEEEAVKKGGRDGGGSEGGEQETMKKAVVTLRGEGNE